MSIRLEEKTMNIGGKTYVLHVNMSVLDRIQEASDGDFNELMKKSMNNASVIIMAAMLNDFAEDQGWEEEWTERKVKKYFSLAMLRDMDVTGMFFRSITPVEAQKQEPENSGN